MMNSRLKALYNIKIFLMYFNQDFTSSWTAIIMFKKSYKKGENKNQSFAKNATH